MRLHNSLRIVWIPIVLQFACIVVIFALDRPHPRELVPIWIPWTLIMMAVAAVVFGIHSLATQAKSAFLRCLCTMALVIVGAWILWSTRGGGDPLAVVPVQLNAVLALLYGALSIWRMIRRRFPNIPLEASVAWVLALISALVIAGVFHLAFIFPRTVAVWSEEGRALSVVQTTLINLSNVCKSFGLLVIPVLLLILIGCSRWAVVAGMAMKRKTANKALDDTSL
jgi:hypothetical protein